MPDNGTATKRHRSGIMSVAGMTAIVFAADSRVALFTRGTAGPKHKAAQGRFNRAYATKLHPREETQ